eukprot:GHVS01077452.1.p1 GENE.GHVS01077452.1~~GHVS01077452.1.p1  ORF type:complete len:223 (+),score=55.62 GHVS01077452.1:85-753(+)
MHQIIVCVIIVLSLLLNTDEGYNKNNSSNTITELATLTTTTTTTTTKDFTSSRCCRRHSNNMNRSVSSNIRLTTTRLCYDLLTYPSSCCSFSSSPSYTKPNIIIPLPSHHHQLFHQHQPLPIASSFTDLVGNTRIVQLKIPSELTGCRILGKCDFMNPGGSVKDRPAVKLIKEAEQEGQQKNKTTTTDNTNSCLLCFFFGYENILKNNYQLFCVIFEYCSFI